MSVVPHDGPPTVTMPFEEGAVVVAASGAIYVLDEPGRRLWDALEVGCSVDELVAAKVRESGVVADRARDQLKRTLGRWRGIGLLAEPSVAPRQRPEAALYPARRAGTTPALDAAYLAGDVPVRVRCDDPALGRLIEAACVHMRVDESDPAPCVDLLEANGKFTVVAEMARLTANVGPTASPACARHRCLTALLEVGRPGREWLGIVHASAVAEGGRCVVLSGASGSGKSTLAAALVVTGASFVTDDYAPLESGSWLVWPVPYAPSIKQGSWATLGRYVPALRRAAVHRHRGLRIRYLDLPQQRRAALGEGLPVAALVFPLHKAGSAQQLRRLTATQALTKICEADSILDRRPTQVAETLRWISSVPAYELRYGDLDAAVDRVRSLLLDG